ncbi:DUF969 domain-containing protein [Novosphingobium piscinae]|uniref:DUF969 domain-containing protein n=1 Tax=Novosphingobium piscinae TaxID=1507448 RepID=A0A7X1FVB7_9SPHN|nr:DUF969 domain-containing protein [Novosphingobium piscinae]MBC2667653.1 DUF969 domain-containing protein [Novosphingobium piscinae]
MWVLSGIVIIILGFALRLNPMVVILAAAAATGLAGGLDLHAIIAAFGKAFNEARYVSIIWMILPVIGLLEAHGLQERAREIITRLKGATTGRILLGYLVLRQLSAAIGLTSIAGHAQTVRPLLAPMAEASAEAQAGALNPALRDEIREWSAATDNVGLFFGEDIFLAIGSILLMKGVMEQYGIMLEPFELSVWAIPSAVAALLVHGWRLRRLDRRLAALGRAAASGNSAA